MLTMSPSTKEHFLRRIRGYRYHVFKPLQNIHTLLMIIYPTRCVFFISTGEVQENFMSGRRKLLRLNWKFHRCFLYLLNYYVLSFDFLSRTVKKLFRKLYFSFLKIYNIAPFQNILQNSFLCFSLMSQELVALIMNQLSLILTGLWYQMWQKPWKNVKIHC
jgi:hypothetical protein